MIDRDFEIELRKCSELYVQIGVLEKLLRVTIPRSLGSDPHDPLDLKWMEKLPVDLENESRYRKALVVFREFDAHLYQAHKDRNFIAHYNTSAIKGVDASLKNVRWLQKVMGSVETE